MTLYLLHIIYVLFYCDFLFTFVRQGTVHAEFNSVVLFTVLYSRLQHCAKDVFTFTAQPTILEYVLMSVNTANQKQKYIVLEEYDLYLTKVWLTVTQHEKKNY